ncbi:anti-sigma factor family protein [Catenovulum adriaticum]|uniref:Anti-sigma factor RsiW n=1 Tax=Catenovulum adriaticum TaxID=2984846 RepID=A0ABY7AMF4_9ALTE|nr:hypothetical protein [Catenovulum sp. TS8]WAJ70485.1 hypothetical protein OLW01_01310 [Catenovulum sp. TS8]
MSTPLKPNTEITDEQLSAFLDAELDDAQMEQIRECIATDDSLVSRVEELALADKLIIEHYAKINQRPLPETLQQMLAALPDDSQDTSSSNDKVVKLSAWQSFKRSSKSQLAMAASVALLAGMSLSQLYMTKPVESQSPFTMANWSQINNVLNVEPSNKVINLAGNQLQAKLSFKNKQGQYCRQFEISNQTQVQNNIACKMNSQWQLTASFYQAQNLQAEYQTASANGVLKQAIDNMAQGSFLNRQAEQQAIKNDWSTSEKY